MNSGSIIYYLLPLTLLLHENGDHNSLLFTEVELISHRTRVWQMVMFIFDPTVMVIKGFDAWAASSYELTHMIDHSLSLLGTAVDKQP